MSDRFNIVLDVIDVIPYVVLLLRTSRCLKETNLAQAKPDRRAPAAFALSRTAAPA